MKLKKFLLNETGSGIEISSDPSEIRFILTGECNQIIKIYNQSKGPLFRGAKNKPSNALLKKIPRITHRNPRNMPVSIHDELNYEFKKIFGWPVRNGVFATSNENAAANYGNLFVFFPSNGFKYCWAEKIDDMYMFDMEKYKSTEAAIKQEFTDKNIKRAIKMGNEISFNTKYYYLLRHANIKWIQELLLFKV